MSWFKQIRQEELPQLLAKIIPYATLFVVAVSLGITIALGRLDLAAMGSYLAISVALVFIVVIFKPNLLKDGLDSVPSTFTLSSGAFRLTFLFFMLLYIVSLSLLIGNESRPLTYFVLVALMAGVIFFEIITSKPDQKNRTNLVLTQIILLSLNLIFGQTLKLDFFWGDIDAVAHMRWIELTAANGELPPQMGPYQYFPFLHLFQAIGSVVTGMNPQLSGFIFHGFSFAVSILLVYLLVRQLTGSYQLPMVATLIYALNRDVLTDAIPLLTRTMAFYLSLLVLYLLIRRRQDIRLKTMAVFLIIPLTITHNITLAYLTAIFIALIIIDIILHRRSTHISYTYPVLFVIVYISYWMFMATHFFVAIAHKFLFSELPIAIPTQTSVVLAYSVPAYSYLAKYADYIVLAFLAILGIVSQLALGKKGNRLGNIFALFALPALVFYMPTPTAFIYRLISTYRLALVLSPFIVFVVARGVLLFLHHSWSIKIGAWSKRAFTGLAVFLIVSYVFLSVTILGNQTDFNIGRFIGTENRHFFTRAELESFSFIDQRGGGATIYTDYFSLYYLLRWLDNYYLSSDIFVTESSTNYYFLLRQEELASREVLPFTSGIEQGFMGNLYPYRPTVFPHPKPTWEEGAKIYDNGSVVIYYPH